MTRPQVFSFPRTIAAKATPAVGGSGFQKNTGGGAQEGRERESAAVRACVMATVAPAAPSDEAAPLGSSKVSLDDKDKEVAKVGTTTGENKKNPDGTGGGEGGKEEDSSREAMEAEAMKRKRKASEDACLQKAAVARAAIEAHSNHYDDSFVNPLHSYNQPLHSVNPRSHQK